MSNLDNGLTIIETEAPGPPSSNTKIYTYMLAIIIVIVVVFIMYNSYSYFCINRDSDISEPYINTQPRDDPPGDNAFDVESEVKKLVQMQEEYLETLQRSRLGNG